MYLADILSDLTDRKLIEWKDVIKLLRTAE